MDLGGSWWFRFRPYWKPPAAERHPTEWTFQELHLQTTKLSELPTCVQRLKENTGGCVQDVMPCQYQATVSFLMSYIETTWNSRELNDNIRQPVYSSTRLYMFIHFGHFLAVVNPQPKHVGTHSSTVPSAQRWQASWWSGLNDEKQKARAVHSCTVEESTTLWSCFTLSSSHQLWHTQVRPNPLANTGSYFSHSDCHFGIMWESHKPTVWGWLHWVNPTLHQFADTPHRASSSCSLGYGTLRSSWLRCISMSTSHRLSSFSISLSVRIPWWIGCFSINCAGPCGYYGIVIQ